MKFIVTITFLFVALMVGVSGAIATEGVKFKLVKESPNEKYKKDNLVIELNKRTDKSDLKNIANYLRSTRKHYDNLWIAYYLPNMKHGSGAWATSHFTPNLEVRILGTTDKENSALKKVSVQGGKIIGKWIDNRPMAESAMIIFKKSKKTMMKTTYKDGSSSEEELRVTKVHNKVKYQSIEDTFGEYYMLERNGNLGMYSPNGKFGEAKKNN